MNDHDRDDDHYVGQSRPARQSVADLEEAEVRTRQAESAMRTSEARLQSTIENMPVMMDAFDAEGNIVFWNRECERVSGYPAGEIVGNPNALEILYPDSEYRERMMNDWVARGDDYRHWEWEMSCRDGSVKTVAWSNIAQQCPIPGWATWGIGVDVTARKEAESAVEKERQSLRRLLEMQERDRKLVAYEIHDGLVQSLTGALMTFDGILPDLDEHLPAAAKERFSAATELLRTSIEEARHLMRGLRSSALEEFGVVPALECLVAESRGRGGPDVDFVHHVDFDRLALPVELAIFRIVQEGLLNAQRHSGSDRVRIELSQQGDRVSVVIQDWGAGFDPGAAAPDRFGLEGIRRRAGLLGGRATIDSSPGKGTRIRVVLPRVKRSPEDTAPSPGGSILA